LKIQKLKKQKRQTKDFKQKLYKGKLMITKENILIHELIGLKVKVINSLSIPYIGLSGTVVDETKNTFVISTKKGEKRIPKKGCVFLFSLPDKSKVKVVGEHIAFRPYDRPKKIRGMFYG